MSAPPVVCYRHTDRRAGVSCQRCGRAICPSCMVQASVGFHCPECVRANASVTPKVRDPHARPIVTQLLIAANVFVFLADVATLGSAVTQEGLFGGNGGDLSRNGLLVGFGTFDGRTFVGVATGEWWRIFTGGFLHAGLLHLGMNMLVLWLIGSQVEVTLGKARYLALYITSLVAGAFGVLLVDPTAATVGASGAVFGLMGAAFAAQKVRGIDPWKSGLGGLLILNLLITFAIPGISIGGHIGGLIGGLVAGYLIFQLDERVTSPLPAVLMCAGFSAAMFVGCLWAADQWRDPVLGFLSR